MQPQTLSSSLAAPSVQMECAVCAQPARGFHFGAFTCEGCKSFFGRTAQRGISDLVCRGEGNCNVQGQNRRTCMACRYRACVLAGMDSATRMPATEFNKTLECSYYDDKMNMTCPPNFDVDVGSSQNRKPGIDTSDYERVYSSLTSSRDVKPSKEMLDVSTAYGQDPNSLTDEERENLMRKKRKEDAYKTALCESHRRTGACSYGNTCRFAHGLDELRLPVQPRGRSHPKYKTVLCDKFSVTGYCKYGARCQFIHKLTNPVLLKQREDLWRSMKASGRESGDCSSFADKASMFDLNQSMPLEFHNWRSDRNDSSFSRPVHFRSQWPPRF